MESLLRYAFIEQRCNVCGHQYPVTLLETLMEQRLLREWHSPRHCAQCEAAASPLVDSVPADVLETLERAWESASAAVANAGFDLQTGEPEAVRHPR